MPSRTFRNVSALAVIAALSMAWRAAGADDGLLPLWRVDGPDNSVYILGSVHLLRESDYPIPAAIYAAYEDAEALIMELDMDDLDPALTQQLVGKLGIIQGPGSLESILGADAYAAASRSAAEAGISLEPLQRTEPWFAAINVEHMILTKIGFDPAFGIEAHFVQKAALDHKEIIGLETMQQQLEMLDGLSPGAQRALLEQTLEEGLELGEIMDQLINAWRSGDMGYIRDTMLQDMQENPELYAALVQRRNAAWMRQLKAYLDGPDDYLVIVGALHLIGDDGLPAQLSGLGYTVSQVQQP